MAKPYKILREKMSPEARERAEAKTQEILNRISFRDFLITKSLKEPLDAVVEPDGDGFIARTPDILPVWISN